MTLLPLFLALEVGETDTELSGRLQRRDPQAMADLYDRYSRLTYSLILRIVGDSGVAEDLTQETFLRVWNRARSFDGRRGTIGAWLLAVARNRAIDYLRSAGGRLTRHSYEIAGTEAPALFSDLEADLISSDKARRIREAVAKLNANQRAVIELAYFEGLSQTEMAEKMGQPLGTIKTWTRGALQSLRGELGTMAS